MKIIDLNYTACIRNNCNHDFIVWQTDHVLYGALSESKFRPRISNGWLNNAKHSFLWLASLYIGIYSKSKSLRLVNIISWILSIISCV